MELLATIKLVEEYGAWPLLIKLGLCAALIGACVLAVCIKGRR